MSELQLSMSGEYGRNSVKYEAKALVYSDKRYERKALRQVPSLHERKYGVTQYQVSESLKQLGMR
ncbi:hypothetical protein LR3_04185 [Limosilactobacillus reuteri]|uniref:Uncharacterized protein n=1 Tax=Limosilactobacillus reuteri TaxID=1598 RepID=A0A073JRD6_LIMRT|nr:hypothetical protein LR3_04185 [Limosilactobacillus reuteri]